MLDSLVLSGGVRHRPAAHLVLEFYFRIVVLVVSDRGDRRSSDRSDLRPFKQSAMVREE